MYPNQHTQTPGNHGPGQDLQGGFASILAAMVALLLGSPFNAFTLPYVIVLAEQSHGPEVVDLIGMAWTLLAYPLLFFAARASIAASLSAAGVYLAYRFI